MAVPILDQGRHAYGGRQGTFAVNLDEGSGTRRTGYYNTAALHAMAYFYWKPAHPRRMAAHNTLQEILPMLKIAVGFRRLRSWYNLSGLFLALTSPPYKVRVFFAV